MSRADKPTVLIVGAGMGGLLLGALLEKCNIPYLIFERATTVKPLGSAMTIGPTIIPIFQQLGIFEEFLTIGKYWDTNNILNGTLKNFRPASYSCMEEFTGYGQYIVARPKLYDLILSQVPASKINFGQRVLNISEEEGKVSVHLADNRIFDGDIVVGADGAYSAVRQRMYEHLKAKGELPKSDQEDLPFSCTCLVGQTNPLDPEEHPAINEPKCVFNTYISDTRPFSWHTFTTAQNTIAYMVVHYLDAKTSKAAMEQRFRHTENSEWGSHTAQSMCDETRDFPIVAKDGSKYTLGDLFEQTPKELISKVMLEEKVFQTWYSGRYVLLGDACHKLHPAGGHGAMTAMHDAISFANLLYAMPATTEKEVTALFKEYHKERLPAVIESFNYSRQISKVSGRGLLPAAIFYFFTHVPIWLWRIMVAKTVRFRPQAGFLEPIKIMGSVAPAPSPSELMARTVFEKQKQAASSI
ncbi:hypothetical protein FBU30_007509 [Linnemannia zychae]|nr:hypothetical protein FBU30_007509 [Linnemannia zychae]